MGGIGIWQLLIVLAIVVLLFGTKRLKSLGSDVGGAVKGFRKAMDTEEEKPSVNHEATGQTYESKVHESEEEKSTKS